MDILTSTKHHLVHPRPTVLQPHLTRAPNAAMIAAAEVPQELVTPFLTTAHFSNQRTSQIATLHCLTAQLKQMYVERPITSPLRVLLLLLITLWLGQFLLEILVWTINATLSWELSAIFQLLHFPVLVLITHLVKLPCTSSSGLQARVRLFLLQVKTSHPYISE